MGYCQCPFTLTILSKKMKTLLLPGANPRTIEWLNELTNELNIVHFKSNLHKYVFWQEVDADKYVNREVSNLSSDHYGLVIAKSFGSLVLLEATLDKQVTWDKAIIFGVPLKITESTKFNFDGFKILKDNSILIVQQRDDILGKAEELKNYCDENLLVIDGSDHQYEQFHLYKDEVVNWLK